MTSWRGSSARMARGKACPQFAASTRTSGSRSSRSRMLAATGWSTASRMLEREVKLGAGPAFHLPDLNGVVDGIEVTPPEAVRLETVYYDTPDLRLARWGVSLRHRAGEGWTLKLPAKPGAGQPAGQVLAGDELTLPAGQTKP